MRSSSKEELRRACSTSLGDLPAIGFPSAALAGGVFAGRLLGGFFGLILTYWGILLWRSPSFGATCFPFLRRLSRCRRPRRGSRGDSFLVSEVDFIVGDVEATAPSTSRRCGCRRQGGAERMKAKRINHF